MNEPDFLAGRLSTAYLEEHPDLFDPDPAAAGRKAMVVAAALLEHQRLEGRSAARIRRAGRPHSRWVRRAGFPAPPRPDGRR